MRKNKAMGKPLVISIAAVSGGKNMRIETDRIVIRDFERKEELTDAKGRYRLAPITNKFR